MSAEINSWQFNKLIFSTDRFQYQVNTALIFTENVAEANIAGEGNR